MKKIKVKIYGHPITDVHAYSYFILTTLKKYYEVEISDNPDYIFYTDASYDHLNYDCIKIYYTGENVSPNFNLCDYAIGFDYMQFEDRYYRMPLYLVATFYNPDELALAGPDYLTKERMFSQEDLAKKSEFCSFIYSNYRSDIERKLMFETLSTYKKVNAAGSYLNNNGGTRVKNKLEYDMKHKFTIAFENSSRSGYTTEKITSALVANTIPIYWGNPNIAKEFNTKRFINCHDYNSFEEVLTRVQELDTNDELYLKTINEQFTAAGYDFNFVKNGFDTFIRNIIDQPLEKAKRRTINPVQALAAVRNERVVASYVKKSSQRLKILATLYKPFKKIKFFEKLKLAYFSQKKKTSS